MESGSFTGRKISIVVGSADNTRLLVLNGLYWTVDITGESDGLFHRYTACIFAFYIHIKRNSMRTTDA